MLTQVALAGRNLPLFAPLCAPIERHVCHTGATAGSELFAFRVRCAARSVAVTVVDRVEGASSLEWAAHKTSERLLWTAGDVGAASCAEGDAGETGAAITRSAVRCRCSTSASMTTSRTPISTVPGSRPQVTRRRRTRHSSSSPGSQRGPAGAANRGCGRGR
eukprot:1769247-Prymnesium_polylepis.2